MTRLHSSRGVSSGPPPKIKTWAAYRRMMWHAYRRVQPDGIWVTPPEGRDTDLANLTWYMAAPELIESWHLDRDTEGSALAKEALGEVVEIPDRVIDAGLDRFSPSDFIRILSRFARYWYDISDRPYHGWGSPYCADPKLALRYFLAGVPKWIARLALAVDCIHGLEHLVGGLTQRGRVTQAGLRRMTRYARCVRRYSFAYFSDLRLSGQVIEMLGRLDGASQWAILTWAEQYAPSKLLRVRDLMPALTQLDKLLTIDWSKRACEARVQIEVAGMLLDRGHAVRILCGETPRQIAGVSEGVDEKIVIGWLTENPSQDFWEYYAQYCQEVHVWDVRRILKEFASLGPDVEQLTNCLISYSLYVWGFSNQQAIDLLKSGLEGRSVGVWRDMPYERLMRFLDLVDATKSVSDWRQDLYPEYPGLTSEQFVKMFIGQSPREISGNRLSKEQAHRWLTEQPGVEAADVLNLSLPVGPARRLRSAALVQWALRVQERGKWEQLTRVRATRGPHFERLEFRFIDKIDEIQEEDLDRGVNTPVNRAFANAAKRVSAKWLEELGKDTTTISWLPEGWQIYRKCMKLLTTPSELMVEGEQMQHCVGGYADAVRRGDSYIFSIRVCGHRSTAELGRNGRVLQHRAENNGEPHTLCEKVLRKFVKKLG